MENGMNHAVSRGNNVGSFEDKKPDLNRTLIDLDTRDQNAEGNGAQELSTDLDSGHQKPFVEQVSELLLQTATQSGGNSYALVPSDGKRSVWIKFKQGRPTEVDMEEKDVHVDHLKKRLKTMFPRHLGHLEAFEFAIKLDPSDGEAIPEDLPIDLLRTANKAVSPLYVDTPEGVYSTPIKVLEASRSPFTSPNSGPILEPSVGKLDGITGGYIQSSMITPIDPSQSAKQRVRQNPSSVDAKKNVHHKKAADGLSKGHAVVLLLNGEEVGKARIISCERGGHCKLRLRSYTGNGNTMTPDGKLFRELGAEEFIWPRVDCKRDYRNADASE